MHRFLILSKLASTETTTAGNRITVDFQSKVKLIEMSENIQGFFKTGHRLAHIVSVGRTLWQLR